MSTKKPGTVPNWKTPDEMRKDAEAVRLAKAGIALTAPAPVQETIVVVEIDGMHESDAIALRKRFRGSQLRVKAACEELDSQAFGRFDPPAALASLDSIQRAVEAARGILMRVASIALALAALAGCGSSGNYQGGSSDGGSSSSGANHVCVDGQCSK